jgi:glyoxylase I family protein
MSIKSIHHVCVQTDTYKESLEFYTKILGFEIVKETPDFHTRDFNTWLKLGDFMIELQTGKKGEKLGKWRASNEGIVHMCFFADNIRGEFERIINAGYKRFKLKNGEAIYKVEDGYLFKIQAPEGTEIEIRDTLI